MPILPWSKGNAQRKFIDLINEVTFKWANWDPPNGLQIGDFGVIDKKTGELKVEGNIYTHPQIKGLAQDFPAYVAPETDLYQIHSQQVKRLEVQPDAKATAADDQGVALRTQWQFNNKRGAILLMHRPRLICVPDGFFKEKEVHEKFDLPILHRKVVVEQVYNCPGFYMYLSNKSSEKVTVTLRSNTFPPASPDASTESTLLTGWTSSGSTGVCQQAYKEDATYTPLFRLKSLGRRHWRRDGVTPMLEKWEVTYIPWGILDEEGLTEPDSDEEDDE